MTKILLEEMEFYAYHGHFKEEQLIGNRFIVNLEVETDTSKAEETDNLQDTVNYQEVYQVVKESMSAKSHLLEHLSRRILNALFRHFPAIRHIRIRVSKMNPPMGGQMKSVSLEMEQAAG